MYKYITYVYHTTWYFVGNILQSLKSRKRKANKQYWVTLSIIVHKSFAFVDQLKLLHHHNCYKNAFITRTVPSAIHSVECIEDSAYGMYVHMYVARFLEVPWSYYIHSTVDPPNGSQLEHYIPISSLPLCPVYQQIGSLLLIRSSVPLIMYQSQSNVKRLHKHTQDVRWVIYICTIVNRIRSRD